MTHGAEKSDSCIVPAKLVNKATTVAAEPVEGRRGTAGNASEQTTVRTQSRSAVSHAQTRIREAVNRNKQEKLTALMHHVTVDVLRHAFFLLKRRAAAGVDGMTWADYDRDREVRLIDLHGRLHRGAYRASPSRRSYISKANGDKRPLGVAAMEDKIVQAAMVLILTPIYEAEFLGFSYGFRPWRSQHDALDALAFGIKGRNVRWVLDADIRSFFDTINHDWLIKFVEHRIGDPRVVRLIAKWLKAGVMENGLKIATEEGTPQGAVISPLLANIYLHYVYDLWAHAWRRRIAGDVVIVRYADDTIVGFQYEGDARRFLDDLKARLARFGLSLNADKTRLIAFGRFVARDRQRARLGRPETFDFLGFTHICGRKRGSGHFQLVRKTRRRSKWTAVGRIVEGLRRLRHAPIDKQGRWLASVLKGHYAYFSVPTNIAAVRAVRHHAKVRWYLSLRRRSQRTSLTWRRMNAIVAAHLPWANVLHPWPEQRFLVKHPR